MTDDDRATWLWTSLTPHATEDNIRPFVPRGEGERNIVLWVRGSYITYQDYDTNVVGVIQ